MASSLDDLAGYHPIISCEGKWNQWCRTKKKPSDFCKQSLGMKEIKTESFLEKYWDVESIANVAYEYKRLSNLQKYEICLADLIK